MWQYDQLNKCLNITLHDKFEWMNIKITWSSESDETKMTAWVLKTNPSHITIFANVQPTTILHLVWILQQLI
jgi:hypothetical protein